MLGRLDPEFCEIHGCLVELAARGRLALQLLLDPGEGVGPDGLEAKIAAPDPSRQGRHDGQQDGEKQEQERQHPEILGQDGRAKDVVLTRGYIPEDGLPAIPAQVGANEKQDPDSSGEPLDGTPLARHALGVNGLPTRVDVPLRGLGIEVIRRRTLFDCFVTH